MFNEFILFRDNFFKLWYECKPFTSVYINYDTVTDIITIKLEYYLFGLRREIQCDYYLTDNIDYHDIVEDLLIDYETEYARSIELKDC